MSSLPNEPQPAPQQLPITTTETVINAAGPGPFSVYSPGITISGLAAMVYLFNRVPGGEVLEIKSGEVWADQMHLDERFATKQRVSRDFFGNEVSKHRSREVPAQVTLDALISDRSITSMGLVQVPAFARVDAYVPYFNNLIRPERIEELTYPPKSQYGKMLRDEGMLAVRKMWLEQALESLITGRMLEDTRRVIERAPYLQELWSTAIEHTLLPQLDIYEQNANVSLSNVEEMIQAKEMRRYDRYARKLMWLLGRKAERTALSRTMEAITKTPASAGGSSVEDLKVIVETIMNGQAGRQAVAATFEFFPCPRCGNRCEEVYGAPPQICWRCNYSFQEASAVLAPIPSAPTEEQLNQLTSEESDVIERNEEFDNIEDEGPDEGEDIANLDALLGE